MPRRCLAVALFDWRSFETPPDPHDEVFVLRGGHVGVGKYHRGRLTVNIEGGITTIWANPTAWAPMAEEMTILSTDLNPYPPHELS